MGKHLRLDLERLERSLLDLGAEVEEAVRRAMRSLTERRADIARGVIERDRLLDAREVEIEEECLKILALHQPVAADLRFVAACLKINNDLERIGDLAVNIAERAEGLLRNAAPVTLSRSLEPMAEVAVRMLRESLDAFVRGDVPLARQVLVEDDEVDDFLRRQLEELTAAMRSAPEDVEGLLRLTSVSRNLERIADLATNIAEDVVYMVDGEIIRHGLDGGEGRGGGDGG